MVGPKPAFLTFILKLCMVINFYKITDGMVGPIPAFLTFILKLCTVINFRQVRSFFMECVII